MSKEKPTTEEWAYMKANHGDMPPAPKEEPKIEEPKVEPKEPEKEPEPKPEPEVVEEPAIEPLKEPEEEDDSKFTVSGKKYMTEKRARQEADASLQSANDRIKELERLVPSDERDRLIREEIKAYAAETGADEVAAEKLLGIFKKSFGPDLEAVAAFNKSQSELKAREAQQNAVKERERTLGKEFESKEFKALLDEKGITKPEDIQSLKKGLVAEALELPAGIPLARVYKSSDLRDKYEPKESSHVKVAEEAHAGQHEPVVQKKAGEMNKEEWETYKRENLSANPFQVQAPQKNVQTFRP